jgi:hypothetical protein
MRRVSQYLASPVSDPLLSTFEMKKVPGHTHQFNAGLNVPAIAVFAPGLRQSLCRSFWATDAGEDFFYAIWHPGTGVGPD